jgi:hypothetical protein
MRAVIEEEVIRLLTETWSDTSRQHEPFSAVSRSTGMSHTDVAAYVEDLVRRGRVHPTSTVADGKPYKSKFGWEQTL